MVTLNSPSEIFTLEVFLFINKSLSQLYFPLHINLVGNFFVLPHFLHVN